MSLSPKVLVNSIPKSGTHLLLQIILGIPGMIIIFMDYSRRGSRANNARQCGSWASHSFSRTDTIIKAKEHKGHFYHERSKRYCT